MKTQYLINTLELSGAILLSEQGFQVMFHCLQAVMVAQQRTVLAFFILHYIIHVAQYTSKCKDLRLKRHRKE